MGVGGGGRGVSPPSSSTSDSRYRRHVIYLRHGEEDGGEEEEGEEQQAEKLDFDDGDFGGFVLRGCMVDAILHVQRFFTVFLFFPPGIEEGEKKYGGGASSPYHSPSPVPTINFGGPKKVKIARKFYLEPLG